MLHYSKPGAKQKHCFKFADIGGFTPQAAGKPPIQNWGKKSHFPKNQRKFLFSIGVAILHTGYFFTTPQIAETVTVHEPHLIGNFSAYFSSVKQFFAAHIDPRLPRGLQNTPRPVPHNQRYNYLAPHSSGIR